MHTLKSKPYSGLIGAPRPQLLCGELTNFDWGGGGGGGGGGGEGGRLQSNMLIMMVQVSRLNGL